MSAAAWSSAGAELKGEPANLEAEQALIGSAIGEPEAYLSVRDLIAAEQFYEPLHQRLWALIAQQIEASRAVVPARLMEGLKGDGAFNEFGGARYLADLVDRAPPVSAAPEHARIIADLHVRRCVIAVGQAVLRNAADPGRPGHEIAAEARRQIEEIEHGAAPDDNLFVDARQAGAGRLERLEVEQATGKPKGARCGLSCVDRRLGGLLPGSLIVMAGRPGMGKTALLGNVLFGAARENPGRLFAGLSLEMDTDQLMDRALSRLAAQDDDPIPYERLGKGMAAPMDLRRLHELKAYLPANLLLRDRAGLSVESVARAVWWLKRKGDLAAVGIDYLQIMKRPAANGRNEASVIGEMTTALKTLARDAKIAIILLSQLNRSVESRDDKRPMLSDLKESGSIEQDADAVLFPFREAYYLAKAEPRENTAEHLEWQVSLADLARRMDVHIGKNRHGGEGTERQTYEPAYDLITNWSVH